MQKSEDGNCIGKFIFKPLYKKGDEILDFNKIYKGSNAEDGGTYQSYQLPSYSLRLDVITSDFEERFTTDNISENEFNAQQ